MSKKEEQEVEDMSFSILGEYVMELPQNRNANPIVKDIRSLFINLRICINENLKNNNSKISCTLPFEIYGEKRELKKFFKIVSNIEREFEYYFFKTTKKNIQIDSVDKKIINKKPTIIFEIKEA